MRTLNIRTPMKVCILLWENADGTWQWSNDWPGADVSVGFRTRDDAVNDVGLFGGEKYWWPQFVVVTPRELGPGERGEATPAVTSG